MPYDPDRHHRRSIRLKTHDYTEPGAYFVTICVQNHLSLFGTIQNGQMQLNHAAHMLLEEWLRLPERFSSIAVDAFVVMPDHVHAIVVIQSPPIVGATLVVALPEQNQNLFLEGNQNGSDVEDVRQGVVTADAERAPTRGAPTGMGDVLGAFKSITTNRYIRGVRELGWMPFEQRLWQRGYFETIIRDERHLEHTRAYIQNNPSRWLEHRGLA